MNPETSLRPGRHEQLGGLRSRVGAASAVITPPPGPMAGYAARVVDANDTAAELMTRVTVVDDGTTAVAIVVLDLLTTTRALTDAVREAVAAATPVPAEHVVVCATHTHCGPADLATTAGSVLRHFVADACARAAERAWAGRRDVVLVAGESEVAGVSAQRRSRAQQPDQTLTVLAALDRESGDPVATIISFACHATVHGPETLRWAPDFPGAACGALDRWVGGGTTYLQGCAGDINPVVSRRDEADAVRIGEIIAAAALQLVRDGQGLVLGLTTESPSHEAVFPAAGRSRCRVVAPAPLRVAEVLVDVDLAPRPGRHESPTLGDPFSRSEVWVRSLRARHGNLFGCYDETDRLTVQVVRLGLDLQLVALPGEPMSLAGRLIREEGRGTVLVAGYAHSSVGYLPSREDHLSGGYEVGACVYHPGALERVIDAATSTMRDLS